MCYRCDTLAADVMTTGDCTSSSREEICRRNIEFAARAAVPGMLVGATEDARAQAQYPVQVCATVRRVCACVRA